MRRFRGDDPSILIDDRHEVPIRRFRSLAEVSWDTDSRARYLVADEHPLPIDVLLIPRQSDRLIVAFHGAENLPTDLPKFQFARSMEFGRNESVLFLSDSSLLLDDQIGLTWMVGTPEFHLAPVLSQVVREVGNALGVRETVLIGHSAGGFAAIAVGSQVPNSRAISVNGQTLTWEYENWAVEKLRQVVFPQYKTIDDMVAAYPDRLDLRHIVANRVADSTYTYFAHRDDDASMGRMPQFPRFVEALGLSEEGGVTPDGDALVPCWWETGEVSAHAIPGTILPFLQLVLGETPSREVQYQVDPRWYRTALTSGFHALG